MRFIKSDLDQKKLNYMFPDLVGLKLKLKREQ